MTLNGLIFVPNGWKQLTLQYGKGASRKSKFWFFRFFSQGGPRQKCEKKSKVLIFYFLLRNSKKCSFLTNFYVFLLKNVKKRIKNGFFHVGV